MGMGQDPRFEQQGFKRLKTLFREEVYHIKVQYLLTLLIKTTMSFAINNIDTE